MFQFQKNCKVSFELPDGLRERYKAASFLQAFFQNGGFEINSKFFDNHLNDEAKAKRNSDALERIAMSCRRVVDMLDKLNCSDDIFISQMKPVDWRNLDSLVKAILDNVPIKNLPSNCAYVGKYGYCQELCANTTASLMKLVRRRPNRPQACSAWLPISGPPVVRQGWRSHLRSP